MTALTDLRPVVEVPALSKAALDLLIDQQALAVRVPDFISAQACAAMRDGLKRTGYDDYLNAPSVGRIGMSYFETGRKQDLVDFYFDTARANIQLLREACAPHPCPIDTLRCLLDEVWPAGCMVQTLYGRKMFVGLSRCMKPGVPLLAHHDMFGRHAPGTPEAASLISQFGINVYVDMPAVGGELAMWNEEISDEEFLRRRGTDYGMQIEPLGRPDLKIQPRHGDLILFNARKLHAVLMGHGADRLTLSAFFGYRGPTAPLTVWS